MIRASVNHGYESLSDYFVSDFTQMTQKKEEGETR